MSYIDELNNAAAKANEASDRANSASLIIHDVANGTDTETVPTANGHVLTVANAIRQVREDIASGGVAPITEAVTIESEGQLSIAFQKLNTNGLALYIGDAEVGYNRYFDFEVTASDSVNLFDAFPVGTVIYGVAQEIGGDVKTAVQQTEANATLAGEWATKTDGMVGGVDYSAKYYSQQSAQAAKGEVDVHRAEANAHTPGQVGADPSGTAQNIFDTHILDDDPHSQYATDLDLQAHEDAADPHSQYQMKIKHNLVATTNPTVSDDSSLGYEPLSRWVNTSTNEMWVCVNASVGAADWQQMTLTLDDLGTAATVNVGSTVGEVRLNEDNEALFGTKTEVSTAETNAKSYADDTKVAKTSDTGAAELPTGTTAQRPSTPKYGYTRVNTDINAVEWWNGSAWEPVGSGAKGSGGNQVFVENDQVVTGNYTIPSNKNAMTTGPITIADGVTVTVSDGARWIII